MVTRAQVLGLLAQGSSYEQAAQALGIRPGKAYLVATGMPADGSNALAPEQRDLPGVLAESTQHLSNPPHVNPTVKPEVLAWVAGRAARDNTRAARDNTVEA